MTDDTQTTIRTEARHEMILHFDVPDGLVPDMPMQYTANGKFRPETGGINYARNARTGEWVTTRVSVRGKMVLKSGKLGVQEYSWRTYSELRLPGWLTDLVRENRPTI